MKLTAKGIALDFSEKFQNDYPQKKHIVELMLELEDNVEKYAKQQINLSLGGVGVSLSNKTSGHRLNELKRYFAAKDLKQLPHYTEYHCKKAHINKILYD